MNIDFNGASIVCAGFSGGFKLTVSGKEMHFDPRGETINTRNVAPLPQPSDVGRSVRKALLASEPAHARFYRVSLNEDEFLFGRYELHGQKVKHTRGEALECLSRHLRSLADTSTISLFAAYELLEKTGFYLVDRSPDAAMNVPQLFLELGDIIQQGWNHLPSMAEDVVNDLSLPIFSTGGTLADAAKSVPQDAPLQKTYRLIFYPDNFRFKSEKNKITLIKCVRSFLNYRTVTGNDGMIGLGDAKAAVEGNPIFFSSETEDLHPFIDALYTETWGGFVCSDATFGLATPPASGFFARRPQGSPAKP